MKDKQVKYGIFISYFYVLLNVISGLLVTSLIIRELGSSQYGIYEIIVSLISDIGILNLGMSDCIVKYVSTYRTTNDVKKQEEVIGSVFKILIVAATIAFIICSVVYLRFDIIYAQSLSSSEIVDAKKLLILASFNLIISLPCGVFSCVLTAYEKFAVTRGLNVAKLLLKISIVLIGLNFYKNAMMLLTIDVFLNVLDICINYILMRKWLQLKVSIHTTDKDLYRKIFTFSGYTIFFIIAREVQWQTDKTIIGLRLNTHMVTVYSAGAKISSVFNQLGLILSGLFLPRAVRITESGGKESDYRSFMVEMNKLVVPFLIAVLIGYYFMGSEFVTLWIGEGYELGYYSSFIMMLAVFLPIIMDPGMAILKARDKYKGIAVTWLISSLVNIVLTWITVKPYGMIAASVCTFVTSYFVNMLWLCVFLKKEIDFKFVLFLKSIFSGLFIPSMAGILYFVIIYLMNLEKGSWFSFIFQGAGFVLIYMILLYICYLDNENRDKIKRKMLRFKIRRD